MNTIDNTRVAIVRGESYDPTLLMPAIERAIKLVDGSGNVIRRGDKVFVKINHLPPPSPPERGIVTHPGFTGAVLSLLKDTGADITVGDDVEEENGDDFTVSGYQEMCQRLGVRLVNLRQAGFVARKCNGAMLKEVYLARPVVESDVIINLPKFKTHSLCTLTLSVKNIYGCIPIGLRRQYHGEFLRVADFCKMLVDIYAMAVPHLNLLDGVMAMEGEGPGSGRPRPLGVILASRDGVALDAIAGKIIGLEPWQVPTTVNAGERGLGNANLEKIEVVGESIQAVAVNDFRLPVSISRFMTGIAPRGLGKTAVSQITPRPYVSKKACTACGECVRACPTGAITVHDKNAEINHALCIRCMCCHEVCRFNAITPRRPLAGHIVYGAVNRVKKLGRI